MRANRIVLVVLVVLGVLSGYSLALSQVRGRLDLSSTDSPKPDSYAIREITLENPRAGDSKAYLDLDTGKIFSAGDAFNDKAKTRKWIEENGIDLMCEMRFPTEGFTTYDMVTYPTRGSMDGVWDYSTVANQLPTTDLQEFDQVSVGSAFPKRFLFRTKEGALGVMEIETRTGDPDGIKLRYKLIDKNSPSQQQLARGRRGGAPVPAAVQNGLFIQVAPIAPMAPMAPMAPAPAGRRGGGGGGLQAQPPQTPLEQQVQALQQQLEALRRIYGEQHPNVVAVRQRVETLQQLASAQGTVDRDPVLNSLKQSKMDLQRRLLQAQTMYAADSPTVLMLNAELAALQARIDVMEANNARALGRPTTRPTTIPAPSLQR